MAGAVHCTWNDHGLQRHVDIWIRGKMFHLWRCKETSCVSFFWCVHACSVTLSCPVLCDPMDCSLPGSSVHGILQARILEWVAISSFRESSQPRDQTHVSGVCCIGRQILYHWASWEAHLSGTRLNTGQITPLCCGPHVRGLIHHTRFFQPARRE